MPDHASHQLALGKLPAELLGRLLADVDVPPEVTVGPRLGEDACVIEVPPGALVAAADPITLTGSDAGRYAVLVNANDIAVTGVQPRWFLATVLLPPGTIEATIIDLFAQMRAALAEVGAGLVGGHTEVTAAVNQPVIAGQMLGVASGRGVVTTGGARSGDVVVQLGAAPVEGAAVLASRFADRLPESTRDAAQRALFDPGISVVDMALAAARLGATAMHDPTEGGLAAGLHEVASAAGVAIQIDRSRVRWFDTGLAVCAALGADPWATLASGCVVATFAPDQADGAILELAAHGHVVAAIGSAAAGTGVADENGVALPWPARDEVARLTG